MSKLLHPKATAVWLVDNTTMSFKQIADFVGMHELEIQGIADGDVAGSGADRQGAERPQLPPRGQAECRRRGRGKTARPALYALEQASGSPGVNSVAG